MLRRIVFGIAILVALSAGALALLPVLLPMLVPAETVRAQVAAQIQSRTGWRVAFDGPVTLAVFPDIALTAERLRVESAPDARDALAADIERAAFGLALAPLLSGDVRLTEIALERPVVRIVRGVGPAPGESAAAAGEPERGALSGVSVDRLSVTDGLLVLRGANGETRLDDLSVTLAMPDPARETTIEAAGRLDGRALALSARLDAPAALLAGAEAGFALTLTAPDRLAAPLSAEGRIAAAPARVVLRELALTSGESRLAGDVDLAFAGGAPALDARLAGPLLDLDALLPGGATGGAGSDALDLSMLGALVGDVEIALERLRIAGRDVAPVALSAELDGDAARVVVAQAGLGGGSLSGEGRIGRDGGGARVSGSLVARDLDVAALAPPGAPDVSGRLAADLRFALAGDTRSALVASLNLAGRVTLSEGAARLPALRALAADGDPERLGGLALALDITDLTRPVAATGEAVWRGERFALTGTAALRALISGEPAAVAVELASERLALGYDGTLAPGGGLAGSASLRTGSLRGLLAWLGRPASTPAGLGPFALSGRLDLAPGAVAFTDARIALDGATGAGTVRIAAGPRPRVTATLEIDRLDLNPYFGLTAEPTGAGGGWSETPIDLAALRGVDADLDLRLGALRFRRIETGRVVAAARLESGRLEADLQEIALYGGGGNGRVVVDAAPAEPALSARLTVADLDARGFLDAAAGWSRIEGRGGVSLDVAGRLVTQRTLMESLSGTAGFAFRDGAIRGLDVTALGRLLATGIVDGWRLADDARTELFAFDASFAVEQGRATTQNLRMVGPSIDLTGRGTVDLPAQRLSFLLDPRIALERRRGEGIELVGFGAPIRVEGPWARPRLYPDVAGILQDPVGAYERLRSVGSGVFGVDAPAAGEALERVLGGEAARGIGSLLGAPQPAPPPPAAAQDAPPAAPAEPAFDPGLDTALEAARGLMDLLNRNR